MKKPFISAIIVAGGSGQRFEHRLPKQFVPLAGRPVIWHSLEKLAEKKEISELIVVAPKRHLKYCNANIVKKWKLKKPVRIVNGGKSRQESVSRGLEQISPKVRFVLVHDAVRPLIQSQELEKLIKVGMQRFAAILTVPVKDTVKEVNKNRIVKTHSREKFRLAQTPQIFEVKLLKKAYRKAEQDGFEGTDCSSLVERLGVKVAIVEGSSTNVKITTKDDLRLVAALLSLRKNG